MADLNELVDATIERDCQRIVALHNCSFHKPIKLRPVRKQAHFAKMRKRNFCKLAYDYPLMEKEFRFGDMDCIARTRFIELLASLTLYHFSLSSKAIYIECLDTRGLEFSDLRPSRGGIKLSGFEGKLEGFPKDERFVKYSVGYGRFVTSILDASVLDYAAKIGIKKFKMLYFSCRNDLFDDLISDFCATFMNPGVEHVKLDIKSPRQADDKKISLPKLEEFFGYCKNVKTIVVRANDGFVFDEAGFGPFQRMIENWSAKTSRLELFIHDYGNKIFQIHQNGLKLCVKIDEKWFWIDKWDTEYDTYYFPRAHLYMHHAPDYIRESHHDDILGIPDNELFQNCVQETVEIHNTRVASIIGKQGENIKSIESTFNVKLLLFKPDYIRGISTGESMLNYLKIGGIPANVARAKEHIMAIPDGCQKTARIQKSV